MKPTSALQTICSCIENDRVFATVHFRRRLAERGLVWADVATAVEDASAVRGDGYDDLGRSRWIITGPSVSGEQVSLVCVIDRDEDGNLVVLVTAYWDRPS